MPRGKGRPPKPKPSGENGEWRSGDGVKYAERERMAVRRSKEKGVATFAGNTIVTKPDGARPLSAKEFAEERKRLVELPDAPKVGGRYCEAAIEAARVFVERRGFGCVLGGASQEELALYLGIQRMTLRAWMERYPAFVEVLNEAQKVYAKDLEKRVVAGLSRAAEGLPWQRTVKEYRDGRLYSEKVIEGRSEPSVEAAKFLLTNMAPDRWKLRTQADIMARLETREYDFSSLPIELVDDVGERLLAASKVVDGGRDISEVREVEDIAGEEVRDE